MPTATEVNGAWLKDALARAGYEVRPSEKDPLIVIAKHGTRPNLTARIKPHQRIIAFSHYWSLNKPGWGKDKDQIEAINRANSMGWYDTFFRDKDGDLGVTLYLLLTENVSDADVSQLVGKEADSLRETLLASKLRAWLK